MTAQLDQKQVNNDLTKSLSSTKANHLLPKPPREGRVLPKKSRITQRAKSNASATTRKLPDEDTTISAPQALLQNEFNEDVTPLSLFEPGRRQTLDEIKSARASEYNIIGNQINWASRVRSAKPPPKAVSLLSSSMSDIKADISSRPSVASIVSLPDPEDDFVSHSSAVAPRLSRFSLRGSSHTLLQMPNISEDEPLQTGDDNSSKSISDTPLPSLGTQPLLSDAELSKFIHIELTETETIDIFEQVSLIPHDDDDEEIRSVKDQLHRLEEFRQKRETSEASFQSRSIQTMTRPLKSRYVQVSGKKTEATSCQATEEDIHDAMDEAEAVVKRKLEKTSRRGLANAVQRVMNVNKAKKRQTDTGIHLVHASQLSEYNTLLDDVIKELGFGVMQFALDPLLPEERRHQEWQKLLQADSFRFHCQIIERALARPYFKKAQTSLFSGSDANSETWETMFLFESEYTINKSVTAFVENPSESSVLAVAYSGQDDDDGIVCVWIAKNPKNPERVYYLQSIPTSLCFNPDNTNLLSVGCRNGDLHIFNVHESALDEAIADTRFNDTEEKHCQRITELKWLPPQIDEDETDPQENVAQLLSASVDGQVLSWSLGKGLKPSLSLTAKRLASDKAFKTHKGNSKTAFLARQASITSFDFPRNFSNSSSYVISTDSGSLHQCSLSIQTDYIGNYFYHSAVINRIRFSPFDDSIFASCSDDWTVSIWHIDQHDKPLATLHLDQEGVKDVAWSNLSPTVLSAITSERVLVWDLAVNEHEPLLNVPMGNGKCALTTLNFMTSIQWLLIGDESGRVHVCSPSSALKAPKSKILGQAAKLLLKQS